MANAMDLEHHTKELTNHCRICGQRFTRKCERINKLRDKQIEELIQLTYNIEVYKDKENIHPQQVCLGCYVRMQRIKAATNKRHIQPSVPAFDWKAHSDNGCEVCMHFQNLKRGGRPKRERKFRGRPEGETPSEIVDTIKERAAEELSRSITPSRVVAAQVDTSLLVCPICERVVSAPVQLSCDNVACCDCLEQLLITHGKDSRCPCCNDSVDSTHISKCSKVTCSVIQHLRVKCARGCGLSIMLKDLQVHERSCDPNTSSAPPQSLLQLTLGEMLTTPLNEPLSPDEEKVCTRLVKRATSRGEQLVLKTGGQVCCFLKL